jgi:hypothetical protein
MVNFKKVTAVATSLLMTGLTIGTAVAANYPEPFVVGGAADVAVVYGASAPLDAPQATNIQTDLADYVTSSGPSTVVGGDSVLLAKPSDKLNLGDAITVKGVSLDDNDLEELLADGTYRNDKNTEFSFEQKITLGSIALSHFSDSDYKNKEPTIGFKISSNTPVLNYTLDFITDAESEVSNGKLTDLEQTTLNILGKSYYILSATNGTDGDTKMTLMDAANSAVIREGETTTLDVAGDTYTVSVSYVTQVGSTNKAKLVINGELSNELTTSSDPYHLGNNVYLGIKNIVYNSKESGVSQVEFSIGSGKLELENEQEVEFNDEDIRGLKSYITRGTASSGTERIDNIVLEWKVDEEAFITPEQDLVMPGFGALSLSMGSFIKPSVETVTVDYDGDDSISLEVPVEDGTAKFNILRANSSGEFDLIGKDSDERLAVSASSELIFRRKDDSDNYDRYFVVTYNTTSDAQSYLLSADVRESDAKNRTTIRNEVTGQDICVDRVANDVCTIGDASVTINEVYRNSTTEYVNMTAGTNTNFNTMFTKEGLKIYLPFVSGDTGNDTVTSPGAISFADDSNNTAGHNSDSFNLWFAEEDKDGNKGDGVPFYVVLNDNTDGDLHVTSISNVTANIYDVPGESDDTVGVVVSDLATQVTRIVVSDKGKVEVAYNGEEAYAEVYATAADAAVQTSASGVMVVKDSEVASVATKNLVVVGGSCINTAAAALVGGSYCGEDFTAATGVGANQYLVKGYADSTLTSKLALLVAGYEAADTAAAATYLTTQTVDTSGEVVGPQ